MQKKDKQIKLSFVIPAKDEQQTIEPLFHKIAQVMLTLGMCDFEVILIDDGSLDSSWCTMQHLVDTYPDQVKAVRLRRNFGKSVALAAGFRESSGDVVFTLDADLQDDPEEIPKFLAKLAEGNDLVSGWKENRQDPLNKTLPSQLFNKATAWITGIPLHDFNCGFKAYRSEVLTSVKLYGELHRYIPVLAHDVGFRIGEVSVRHHPRKHGTSKYGWERYARGFLDLLAVLATTRYLQKPGHLFGGLGITAGAFGTAILMGLSILWLLGSGPIGTRPLFFLGILLVLLSVQLISLGVLAELLTKHLGARPLDCFVVECYPCTLASKDSKETAPSKIDNTND